jgi:hypothetical protein
MTLTPEAHRERSACASFLRFLSQIIEGSPSREVFQHAANQDLIVPDANGIWHVDPLSVANAIDSGRHTTVPFVAHGASPLSEAASMSEREEITKFQGDHGS